MAGDWRHSQKMEAQERLQPVAPTVSRFIASSTSRILGWSAFEETSETAGTGVLSQLSAEEAKLFAKAGEQTGPSTQGQPECYGVKYQRGRCAKIQLHNNGLEGRLTGSIGWEPGFPRLNLGLWSSCQRAVL